MLKVMRPLTKAVKGSVGEDWDLKEVEGDSSPSLSSSSWMSKEDSAGVVLEERWLSQSR